MKRVVVTGIGALTPIGNNVESFWDNLVKGESGAGPITKFEAEKFKTRFACELKDFNPEETLDRKEVRKNDSYVVYALHTSLQAIEHSGLDLDTINKERTGVIWATGVGDLKRSRKNFWISPIEIAFQGFHPITRLKPFQIWLQES